MPFSMDKNTGIKKDSKAGLKHIFQNFDIIVYTCVPTFLDDVNPLQPLAPD